MIDDELNGAQYAFAVEMRLIDIEDQQNPTRTAQQKWDNFTEANHKAASNVLGYAGGEKSGNKEIADLSKEQKKIGKVIKTSMHPQALHRERSSKSNAMPHCTIYTEN